MSHLVLFSAHSVTVCSLQCSHAHTCTHTYAFIHTVTYTRTHTYTHAHTCMFPIPTSLNSDVVRSLCPRPQILYVRGGGGLQAASVLYLWLICLRTWRKGIRIPETTHVRQTDEMQPKLWRQDQGLPSARLCARDAQMGWDTVCQVREFRGLVTSLGDMCVFV